VRAVLWVAEKEFLVISFMWWEAERASFFIKESMSLS
jgi:hypothetical protein